MSKTFNWNKGQYLNAIYILGLTELTSLQEIQEKWDEEFFGEPTEQEALFRECRNDEIRHIYFEALINYCEDRYL
jgi:hypothetical protein